jgi:two-component system, cell cycle sensor histidine kinase and response regulator CckA
MDQTSASNEIQAQELSKAYKMLQEYESILNILPDIIYKIDPEGHFVYISNSVTTLGFQPQELLGRHFSILVHPDDVPKISRKYVLPQFQGRTTGDGKAPKLFDEVRTGRRITKNLAVRLVPKFSRQNIDQTALPTIEGEVIASGIYGRLAHEKDKDFEGTSGRIALKTEVGDDGEIRGSQSAAEVSRQRDRIHQDKGFEGTVGVIRDITEQKLLQQKNHQLEQQLFHSNKMQTIGELTGGIAHDFNNLLSIMLGQTEIILKRQEALDGALANSILTIQKTILQAADLNSKLLTFARKVKVTSLPVCLHEIITDTMHLLFHSFDRGIKLAKELTDGPSNIIGDAGLLKNALINIGLNARDAMPEGGQLLFRTVVVGPGAVQACFPERTVPEGDYLAVTIQDNGVGMAPEVLDRIFEPFYTTKSLGKGTGLGLACVDGIVEMHKGFVRAESGKGIGSSFTLYFPLASECAISPIQEGSVIQSPRQAGEHIMIVDDEAIVLETQGLLLTELGYRVTSFSDSPTAVEYYQNHYHDIDLVILDLNMPVLNGKQCFLELKKICPQVRVIISTGCNVDNEADELFKIGITGLIQKPFPIKKLRQTIFEVFRNSPSPG